jgi:hypothetical protein
LNDSRVSSLILNYFSVAIFTLAVKAHGSDYLSYLADFATPVRIYPFLHFATKVVVVPIIALILYLLAQT